MILFLCGLALLFVAFGNRFWEVVGWGPSDDEPAGVTTIRRWVKLIASALSIIFLAYGFPAIPDGVSHPGVVAGAIVFLIVSLTEFPWNQEMFKAIMDDDDDNRFGYGVLRVIAGIIGIVMLVVGIGTGYGDWLWSWEFQEALQAVEPGLPVLSSD